ncbi:hypothetical protein N0V90_012563 [Kalmusia sp. IMI 367209]|nr:hypothetical protein N0V90_012563 [Kalmusia sp. IMI 367209]
MINRTLLRLCLVVPVVLVLISLPLLFEPRRRSFNCRSFWSCISGPSSYNEDVAAPLKGSGDLKADVSEATLPDGTVRFTRRNPAHTPSTLVLVLTRDAGSWSHDYHSTQRSVYDFLDLLASTKLALPNVAVGILTASADEFKAIQKATEGVPLGRVTILQRNDTGSSFEYGDRHKPDIQDERRALLARLRNYLMNGALQDESHIFWVDADVVEFSEGIVQTMLKHAESRADVGILTARCERDTLYNYDMNAWKVAPAELDAANATDRVALQDKLEHSKTWVPELMKDTSNEDLVPLDSVGGTLLYMRAELVRQGLIFPWWSAVGTGWEREGMEGGGCFVLGGSHKTRHADQG